MAKRPKENALEDAIRISNLFATLSEEGKTMALVYLSALRDKELANQANSDRAG